MKNSFHHHLAATTGWICSPRLAHGPRTATSIDASMYLQTLAGKGFPLEEKAEYVANCCGSSGFRMRKTAGGCWDSMHCEDVYNSAEQLSQVSVNRSWIISISLTGTLFDFGLISWCFSNSHISRDSVEYQVFRSHQIPNHTSWFHTNWQSCQPL